MYEALRRVLFFFCVAFVGVGLLVGLAGESVFGLWRDEVSGSLFGHPFPETLRGFARLTDGILGGSIVGKWVATAWLVHEPLRRRERWAIGALLASHLGWFVIDSSASLLYGAAPNIWLINLAPLVLVGGLALVMAPMTKSVPRDRGPVRRSVRVLTVVCAMSIGVGLVSAFLIESPLFGLYRGGIAEAYFAGTIGEEGLLWTRFAYGLIGGTLAGHFIALTAMLLWAPRQRWVLFAVLSSMLAWFVLDSGVSLYAGGAFNVLQVNLPSLLVTLAPLAFALRREDPGPDAVSS